MANTVYTVEEYSLQDGTTVTLKPASIKIMRKGQEMITKLGDTADEDDGIRRLLDIVAVCLLDQRPDFVTEVTETKRGKEVTTTKTNYDLMEDLFDMDTVFKVIEVDLGVKLNDPKLLEMAAQMAMAEQAKAQSSAS